MSEQQHIDTITWPASLAQLQRLENRGMRYYLDTEFIDDGHAIDLISIGIVCEDGREYYAQSCEFDPYKASPWVASNVIAHLAMCYGNERYQPHTILESRIVHNQGKCDLYEVCDLPEGCCPWRTREQIRDEVQAFIDAGQGKPEIYTWCGSYDHIALCQLFGPMMSLPEGWPHHIYDLQCELSDRGIEDHELPQQEQGLHNALDDARHIKRLWQIYGPHIPPYVS